MVYAIIAKNFVVLVKILPTEKIFFSQRHGEIIIFNIILNSWIKFFFGNLVHFKPESLAVYRDMNISD